MSLAALLALPDHRRSRLLGALRTGLVCPPYPVGAVAAAIGEADAVAVSNVLAELALPPQAVALAVEAAGSALAEIDRPELVWSGPEVPGVHARDTRRVFEELVAGAQRSIWVSAYAFFDGPKAFEGLAARLDAVADLQVTLLLNVQRKPADTSAPAALVARFAERFWSQEWPGTRRPTVVYDPRALSLEGVKGVLHAKALVVDERAAFITSANLTEAAFDRNLELGVLSRDRTLASSLARHFRALVDQRRLLPLPLPPV